MGSMNLQLPKMTYRNLAKIAGQSGKPVKIANVTTVHMLEAVVVVTHYETAIAFLAPDWIVLGSRGWSSQRTAARLHEILVDNDIAPTYTVNKRKPSRKEESVLGLFKGDRLVRDIAQRPATFHRRATGFHYSV